MSEHIVVPSLTNGSDLPASVEKTLATEWLRNRLGFTGILTTDDLWYRESSTRFGAEQAGRHGAAGGSRHAAQAGRPHQDDSAPWPTPCASGAIAAAQIDASATQGAAGQGTAGSPSRAPGRHCAESTRSSAPRRTGARGADDGRAVAHGARERRRACRSRQAVPVGWRTSPSSGIRISPCRPPRMRRFARAFDVQASALIRPTALRRLAIRRSRRPRRPTRWSCRSSASARRIATTAASASRIACWWSGS